MDKSVSTLISSRDIAARVRTLATQIAADFTDDLMIVALLRGSFVFAADLIRALHHAGARPQMDFLTLSSYGAGTESSGNVHIHRDMSETAQGRDVLIIDDILESGRTLSFARSLIEEREAKRIKIAVLLEKPGKRMVDIHADYVGFTIEDKFVVGYGLDYANFYRELPYIGVLEN